VTQGRKPGLFERLFGIGAGKPKPAEPVSPAKKEPPSDAPKRKPPAKGPAKKEPPDQERQPPLVAPDGLASDHDRRAGDRPCGRGGRARDEAAAG